MNQRFAKIVKWIAIAALVGGIFLRSAPNHAHWLQFVVFTAALFVLLQAATMRRHAWLILFFVVACLFNPVFAVPFSDYSFGIASTFAALLFFFSLELMKAKTALSPIPSPWLR